MITKTLTEITKERDELERKIKALIVDFAENNHFVNFQIEHSVLSMASGCNTSSDHRIAVKIIL